MTFLQFKTKFQKKEVIEISFSPPLDPVISVLVQTYRHNDFIEESLNNILNQVTNFDFEILVGEDDSGDGTREICMDFVKKHPNKIKLFLHSRDNQIQVLGEASANFNALYNFYSARGKYIAFCEGDDLWGDQLYLQKSFNFLESNPDFVLTYHKYEVINQDGNKLNIPDKILQPEYDMDQEELSKVKHHPILLCTCFRKDIKEIPIEMTEVINLDTFIFSLLGQYGNAKYLDSIIPSLYRKHSGGIWSKRKKDKKSLSKIMTYKKLGEYYKRKRNNPLQTYFVRLQLNNYKMLIMQQVRSYNFAGSIKTGTQYLKTKYNLQRFRIGLRT